MDRPIEEVAKEWIATFKANAEDGCGMTIHTADECQELADLIEGLLACCCES
jgi:hypothetical protein